MSRSCLLALALAAAGCSSAARPPSAPPPRAASAPAAPSLPSLDDELAPLVIRLSVDDFDVRAAAARELGAMGAAATAALPELITCAATEPHEGGGRDRELDPGHLAGAEPTAACADAIAAISAAAPDALVAALAIPLSIKLRALSALADAGDTAVPGAAAVYLDACDRAAGAADPVARRHLMTTADAALAILAASPTLVPGALGNDSDCARTGIARARTLATAR